MEAETIRPQERNGEKEFVEKLVITRKREKKICIKYSLN
jgi:hypothetical protein